MDTTKVMDEAKLSKKERKKLAKKERKERKKRKREADVEAVKEANTSDDSVKSQSVKDDPTSLSCSGGTVESKLMPTIQNHQKSKESPAEPPLKQTNEKGRHPFQVDEADHCETPFRAYQDIIDVLDQIAKACGKDRKSLKIFDPYYCDGGIKKKLESLGFHNVINDNRDFYDDIANDQVPPHDVLITNPPYSGHHMESLLKFVTNNYYHKHHHNDKDNPSKKRKKNREQPPKQALVPFLLLLPHYVYTKPFFQEYFDSNARGREGHRESDSNPNRELFYLVPKNSYRYSYEPPSWVSADKGSTALSRGKTQTAPFPSFWYCHVPSLMMMNMMLEPSSKTQSSSWLVQTFGPSGSHHSSSNSSNNNHQRLHYANCTAHLPREFKGEFDVTNKRPNPRARKRAAKKKTLNGNNNQEQSSQQFTKPNQNSKGRHKRTPTGQANSGGKPKKKRY
ncbi:expressed unknown protein [Seminavis robusta]|uniref:Uncharacterized protein n=1 Tax=Seminavis robusta TaxID=568900 RepID=A0A9N8DCL9_9STRA|nr:expressed unknown protein [Seminavis robusta]|eukprot:Sro35_g022470.1 n/a (451) ;mRNA; r:104959-106311